MSKYKVKFMVKTNKIGSETEETIDLVDDWNYSEEAAEKIVNDEELLRKEFNSWLYEHIETNYYVEED